MPEIALIRAFHYDPTKVTISKVLAPPYDVISEAERKKLEEQDPYNCVRLILPQGDGDEKYDNAARELRTWTRDGILKRDVRPAIYRYTQTFAVPELGGRIFTRKGFVCALRLHPYDDKVVLPHERTMRGPK